MLKSGLRIKTLTDRGGPNDPNPITHPIQFFVTTSFKISDKTKIKKRDPNIFVQPFKNGKTKELVTKKQ